MKRARLLFMIAILSVAGVLAYTLPALATSSPTDTVYYPYGNGMTYSCNGGPPFVYSGSNSSGNCSLQQIGPPSGLNCNVPTDITFTHDPQHPAAYGGQLCQDNPSRT